MWLLGEMDGWMEEKKTQELREQDPQSSRQSTRRGGGGGWGQGGSLKGKPLPCNLKEGVVDKGKREDGWCHL